MVQVVTADGCRRMPDDEVAAIADRMVAARMTAARRPRRRPELTADDAGGATDEHAVLRLARAADEGPGGLRPQGHRPRPRVVVVQYADGILFVAENPSQALHKISEIYDRIAFAAVGRYNEFENLRIAGVRLADMRGYSYDRRDVTGRGLANAYAQTLGTIFSSGGEKPYEVEIFVAEVGDTADDDQIYRLTYDGSVADEHGYAVMGGAADAWRSYLAEHYTEGAALADALRLAVAALGHDGDRPGDPRRATSRSRCSTAAAPSRGSSAGWRRPG